MSKLSIFYLDNSELKESDSIDRGYRSDIYICINNMFYNLNVYDIVRLKQDFETEYQSYGFFNIEPNVIIVNNVNTEAIKHPPAAARILSCGNLGTGIQKSLAAFLLLLKTTVGFLDFLPFDYFIYQPHDRIRAANVMKLSLVRMYFCCSSII